MYKKYLNIESVKIIVHQLNKIIPKNIEIVINQKKYNKLNKIIPSYDEKIIDKMIKKGGL